MTNANIAIYRVDFNAVHPETWLVLGSAEDAEQPYPPPAVGDRVLLRDAEQNRCWASIIEIDGSRLQFQLDESTWRSGPEQVQIANPASASRSLPTT